MKTILALAVIASVVVSSFAVSCVATNFCMGCSATTANVCTSCFNWKAGTIGPKRFASAGATVCTTAHPAVTNCKIYSSGATSATINSGSCQACDEGYNRYLNDSTGTAVYSCVKDGTITMDGAVKCSKIANCLSTVCYNKQTGTDSVACNQCENGKYPTGWNTDLSTPTSCASTGTKITNCEGYSGFSSGVNTCQFCKEKFAVQPLTKTCAAFTTDSACRQLHSGASTCSECWYSYYWNGATCKLASKVVIASAIMALISFLF